MYCINKQVNPGQVLVLTDEEAFAAKKIITEFITAGSLEEVDDTAGPIAVAPIKKMNAIGGIVLPGDVNTSANPKNVVVLEQPTNDILSDNDTGSVIVPGKFPGDGKVVSVEASLAAQFEEAKKVTETLATELQKITPKTPEQKVEYPTDLQNWFTLRHAQKKIELVHTSDITRLNYISEWDKSAKVQKLVAQRLKELAEQAEKGEGKNEKS
jgi:hypothetical protein